MEIDKDMNYLGFEDKIKNIDFQINELKRLSLTRGIDYSKEIDELESKRIQKLKKIYSNLNAWQIVQVARHPNRPIFQNYLEKIIYDFKELHGDRCFGDDRAIITGLGRIGKEKVMIVGQNKRGTINLDRKIKILEDELKRCEHDGRKKEIEYEKKRLFEEEIRVKAGYANPEGYRKAIGKMEFAEKYQIPIVTFIDTPGAYPGVGAEERGQGSAIAHNLMEMSRLEVPIISIIIGEGGSGGALGIGVGDKLAMLEYSYYSVISPEGCAAILGRDKKYADEAAEALRLTSRDLYKLKLIDDIIKESIGGAHRNYSLVFDNVKKYIIGNLGNLKNIKIEDLLEKRYEKLRGIGKNI